MGILIQVNWDGRVGAGARAVPLFMVRSRYEMDPCEMVEAGG